MIYALVYDDVITQIWPIVSHPEQELCTASEALIGEHERRFHFARIIMQVTLM
jgi:hypothetical protein